MHPALSAGGAVLELPRLAHPRRGPPLVRLSPAPPPRPSARPSPRPRGDSLTRAASRCALERASSGELPARLLKVPPRPPAPHILPDAPPTTANTAPRTTAASCPPRPSALRRISLAPPRRTSRRSRGAGGRGPERLRRSSSASPRRARTSPIRASSRPMRRRRRRPRCWRGRARRCPAAWHTPTLETSWLESVGEQGAVCGATPEGRPQEAHRGRVRPQALPAGERALPRRRRRRVTAGSRSGRRPAAAAPARTR